MKVCVLCFNPASMCAFIACDFGVVAFDTRRRERLILRRVERQAERVKIKREYSFLPFISIFEGLFCVDSKIGDIAEVDILCILVVYLCFRY